MLGIYFALCMQLWVARALAASATLYPSNVIGGHVRCASNYFYFNLSCTLPISPPNILSVPGLQKSASHDRVSNVPNITQIVNGHVTSGDKPKQAPHG